MVVRSADLLWVVVLPLDDKNGYPIVYVPSINVSVDEDSGKVTNIAVKWYWCDAGGIYHEADPEVVAGSISRVELSFGMVVPDDQTKEIPEKRVEIAKSQLGNISVTPEDDLYWHTHRPWPGCHQNVVIQVNYVVNGVGLYILFNHTQIGPYED